MPKKPKSLKETHLKNPIEIPIGNSKETPIGKSSLPDFDSIIKQSSKSEEIQPLPESPFYNKDDPKCIAHSAFIFRLEKVRADLENAKTSKFYSKQDALRRGLDEIYRFLKVETGYRPVWLFDGMNETLGKLGRPDNHSYDERMLGSQFIQALIQFGSSQTQAINLLSILKGNGVVTEGFKRDFAETYAEFAKQHQSQEKLTILDLGQIIAFAASEFSLEKTETTKTLIKRSHLALRKICQELIGHIRKHKKLVEKYDAGHHRMHDRVIELLAQNYDDPIEYFIPAQIDESNIMEKNILTRQMIDYLNSIDLFLNTPRK